MNSTENTHRIFLTLMSDPSLKKEIKRNSPVIRKGYQDLLKSGNVKNEKEIIFIEFILEMSKGKYYLVQFPGSVSLVNKEFKSMVNFRYCTTLTYATQKILKVYTECIEIIDLHSKEKGQGSAVMKEFIKLSDRINLPLSLYVETKDLVKYYSKFGFVDHGNLGRNNELLLLRIPEKN